MLLDISATKCVCVCVTDRGLKSEYDHHYLHPSDVKSKEATFHPVDTPYVLPPPGSKSTHAAPNMYKTEYQNVGSNRPITC